MNMEVLMQKTISVEIADDDDENESIEEIQLQFQQRQQRRRERLDTVKNAIEMKVSKRDRKKQNIILYLLNLALPFVLAALNAYNFIKNDEEPELKGQLITVFVFVGLALSLISNLIIAPWKEVIKLYLILDSVVPVMIASIIGFYAVLLFLQKGAWYQIAYAVDLPLWVIYFAGSLRVMIAYANWSRWQVIAYKISVMSCGLVFFYVGFTFMNGGYKITRGYLVSLQSRFKDMTLLYVFGMVEQFFQCYRRLSYFDQTEELSYEYQFEAQSQKNQQRLADEQYKKMQESALLQELGDHLLVKMKSLNRSNSKKSLKKQGDQQK